MTPLPVAEEGGAEFPQRSKNARESESPQRFSGTARWNFVTPLPVAEEGGAEFPQRSKNARESESPQRFSGTARWRLVLTTGLRMKPKPLPGLSF